MKTLWIILIVFMMFVAQPVRGDPAVQSYVYIPLVVMPEPVKGAAWAWEKSPEMESLLGIEWYYNYSPRPAPNIRAAFYPFLWCDHYPSLDYRSDTNLFDLWQENVPPDYDGPALFINEGDGGGSDTGGQCERTPHQAVYIYKYAREICPNCVWVGPVTSHLDYLRGWPWQREFYDYLTIMNLPYPDIGAIHTYLVTEHPRLIIDSYFTMLSAYTGAPQTAWVTEFGANDPAMVSLMIDAWDNDPRITKYAYFAPKIPPSSIDYPLTLIDENGFLTYPGMVYSRR